MKQCQNLLGRRKILSSDKGKIVVFGASGHAKVVIDILEKQGTYQIAFLVDDDPKLWGKSFYGYKVIDGRESLINNHKRPSAGIVAIGDNASRMKVAKWFVEHGFTLANAIHPTAAIARGARISAGTVIMPGVVINGDTIVGKNVIINTGATVDHDSVINDGVHIAPGCHLCGNVSVGDGTLIGAGSIVIPGIEIGSEVFVTAGSTVVKNIVDNQRVTGNPARVLQQ